MTKEELIEIIESWENLPYLINGTIQNSEYYRMLLEMAFYSNKPKSWRAAYLIDKINDTYPELLQPFVNEMIEQLKIEKQSGKKRHFLKLISQNEIPEIYCGFLVDYCLSTFVSAKEPPAVRVHAMQILYNISEKELGLKSEILLVIEHEMENNSTAGILSRGTKLAQKLRKQIM